MKMDEKSNASGKGQGRKEKSELGKRVSREGTTGVKILN